MNSAGQGFDVFKLLIAAVVAGAILLILLQTLQVIPTPGGRNPNELASETVKSQINNLGLPQYVDNVVFKNNAVLSGKTIAENSKALSSDQVCVKITDSTPNKDAFKNTNGRIVQYTGSFDQRTRLVVICDRKNELDDTISDLELEDLGVSTDNCPEPNGETTRYCLISVIADQ